jgi:hypothetical protein
LNMVLDSCNAEAITAFRQGLQLAKLLVGNRRPRNSVRIGRAATEGDAAALTNVDIEGSRRIRLPGQDSGPSRWGALKPTVTESSHNPLGLPAPGRRRVRLEGKRD